MDYKNLRFLIDHKYHINWLINFNLFIHRVIDNLPAVFNKTLLRIALEPQNSIFNEN